MNIHEVQVTMHVSDSELEELDEATGEIRPLIINAHIVEVVHMAWIIGPNRFMLDGNDDKDRACDVCP